MAKEPAPNPQGPEKGNSRVVRGGSWFSVVIYCRVSVRNFSNPNFRDNFRFSSLPVLAPLGAYLLFTSNKYVGLP